MNVKQLRTLLLDYPENLPVLISRDPEGNGFHELVEMGTALAETDETYVTDVYLAVDEDEIENYRPVLVLWP